MRRRIAEVAAVAAGLAACAPEPHPESDDMLPCDVELILERTCQECHGATLQHGAPLRLVTYGDTQERFTNLPTYDRTPTFVVMGDALRAGIMPAPLPGLVFSSEDRAALLRWINAGALPRPRGQPCR